MKGCGVCDVIDFVCGVFVADGSSGRWAVICSGCKGKRSGVFFRQKELRKRVHLLLTAGGGEKVQID